MPIRADHVTKTKNGFTLLEISIVLVVIAIVIGGVLVGQDLIRAAELRAVLSERQEIDVKVQTFAAKFNSLPGDIGSEIADSQGMMSCGVAGRDGEVEDGYIALLPGGSTRECKDFSCRCESFIWGENLLRAELFSEGDVTLDTSSGGLMYYVLSKALPRNAFVPYSWPGYGVLGNWIVLESWRYHAGTAVPGNGSDTYSLPFSGIDAKSIDTKIDDGNPVTGDVQIVGYAHGRCKGHGLTWNTGENGNFYGSCIGSLGNPAVCATSEDPATSQYMQNDFKGLYTGGGCKLAFKQSW